MLPLIFKNLKGTELDEWLKEPENIALILNKRIFYVLKSNLDNSVIKFGVSTNEGSDGDGAYRRLLSYINYYGRTSDCERKSKDCKYGIKIYALYGNDYNKNTEKKNTMVQRKENYIKRELKPNIEKTNRGSERTSTSLGHLIKLIENNRFSQEIVTDTSLKESKRLKEAQNIKENDFYKE